jgi:hypothetical protein
MRKWLPFALILLMTPVVVKADNMTWSFSAYDGNMHFVIPGKDVRTQLGIFTINITDTAPATNWPNGGNFLAFCVDLQHYVGNSQNVVLSDMADWRQPYTSTPDFPDYVGAGNYVSYLINHYGMPDTLFEQSAMQLAVWEILYEDRDLNLFNVSTNAGQAYVYGVSNSLINQANSYLSLVNNLSDVPDAHAPWIQTIDDRCSYYQDFTTPIPEPSTLILIGTGFLVVAVSARRKFR